MLERLNVLDAEKARLEDALQMEQNIQRFHISESHILKYLDSMGGDPRDPETRRWLLDEYVSRVAVTGDTMAVSLHYTDDRREFSIREKAEALAAGGTFGGGYTEEYPRGKNKAFRQKRADFQTGRGSTFSQLGPPMGY